jgi:hypothetical protein
MNRLRVFENRVLRRIFGPKRAEATCDWGNCMMSSYKLCFPPDAVTVIKSRQISWTWLVACMRKMKMHTNFVRKLQGKGHWDI